jgi:pimeloyl-ACP methyl ester carboxylesterase
MRGTGQRSLTSSRTPTRSSLTIAGPTPAAPGRPGWTSTTIGEQADDAAALLRGLDLVPAIVFGTSAAAGILADLCLRHPHVGQGAIFHEAAFPSGVPDTGAVNAARTARIEEGMARGGPRAAMELYLRSVAGDEVYESLDPQLRERLLGNAGVLFGIEMAPYLAYDPAPGELASIRVPRGHRGRRQPRYRGCCPLEIPSSAMARRLPPDHCHRPARSAYGLSRPARALRHSTAADTGQAHLIRRAGARADQTRTKRRTGPGTAQLSVLATYRLRSREPTSLGAALGATGMNSLQEFRTHVNSWQGRIRGHGRT